MVPLSPDARHAANHQRTRYRSSTRSSTTCQYRLVIEPASRVSARVMEWRQQLRERIGRFEAYQMPGITLLGTELPPRIRRSAGRRHRTRALGFAPFALNLGALMPRDHGTIFLDVMEKGTVAALRQRVVDRARQPPGSKLGVM